MPPISPVMRDLVAALEDIFRRATHKRAAHHLAKPVLEQASRDPRFITEALAKYLALPASFNRLNYPVVSLPVTVNPHFELVVNCWIPLPTAETDVTTKAIHHHGDMLLSTATIFGPGYEHWLFTRPRTKAGLVHTMTAFDASPHRLHEVAFVDDHVPHVPLYPKSLSLTLALWSSQFDVSVMDRVKRIPVLQRNSRILREAAVRIGLRQALALKIPEYFDFFPVDGGFEAMKVRKEFDLGPNEDHLRSLFHVILETGNAPLATIIDRALATGQVTNRPLVESLNAELKAERPIAGKLSAGHYDIPFANYRARDIKRALASQNLTPSAPGPASTNPAAA
ncbi:MAG TPA: hypothetical protein VGF45_18050 [Polyangia bacterium]